MDHVEVRQWLADALAAGTLPSVLDEPSGAAHATTHGPTDQTAHDVRAHLATCEPCRVEAGALVTTGVLADGLTVIARIAVGPVPTALAGIGK